MSRLNNPKIKLNGPIIFMNQPSPQFWCLFHLLIQYSAFACIIIVLCIMLVSLISQPCLYIFQQNLCYYLSYVFSTSYRIYKLKLLHKLTTQHTLHSRVKFSIIKISWIVVFLNYRITV